MAAPQGVTLIAVEHGIGDVLDLVHDAGHPPVVSQDRGVDRLPVARLEAAAIGLRAPHVVPTDAHRVGAALVHDALEGDPSDVDGLGLGVVGIVREDLEDAFADDRVALSQSGAKVGITGGEDGEPRAVRRQHEDLSRESLEDPLEVRFAMPPRSDAHPAPCPAPRVTQTHGPAPGVIPIRRGCYM